MQWLIDLIIESIGVPPCFIDRGDPAIPDFDKFALTPDAAWHDLDLSGIVPEGATAVALWIVVTNSTILKTLAFRKNGNVGSANVSTNSTQAANVPLYNDNTVALDADRKIEYFLSAVGWLVIGITVKGWWK